MKLNCDIVQDLLPLYQDEACSEATMAAVEEHLKECPECSNMLEKIREPLSEKELMAEKQLVLKRQSGYFKRKGITAGIILAAILTVPVLVCLIVNIATGSCLGWFFIVLASLMVVASVSVVPVLVPENKCLCTLGAFTACLLLLLLVICLYSGGDWFFTTAWACLFGLGVIFLPFVVRNRKISDFLGKKKALAVFAADAFLFAMLMVNIGFQGSAWPVLLLGGIILPYMLVTGNKNSLFRWGLTILTVGVLFCFFLSIRHLSAGNGFILPRFRPFTWNAASTGDNLRWLALIAGVIIGGIMMYRGKRNEKRSSK